MSDKTNAMKESDIDEDFRSANLARSSAPALVVLVPAILGFASAGLFEFTYSLRAAASFAAIFFVGTFITAKFTRTKTRLGTIIRARIKKASLIALVFFASIVWFYAVAPKNADAKFPATEASVRLKILSATSTAYGGVCGKAVLINLHKDEKLPLTDAEVSKANNNTGLSVELEGKKVWYNFYNDRKRTQNISITPSEEIAAFGAICPIDKSEDTFSRYLYYNGFSGSFSAYIANCKKVSPPNKFREFFSDGAKYVGSVLSSTYFASSQRMETSNRAYRAMILGDKSLLGKEAKKIYSETGVMHIFAVSGLHIATFALAISFILGLLGIPWRLRLFICAPCVFFYAGICSFPPSALRAAAMITFVWGLCALMRKPKTLAALVLSALIFLAVYPRQIFDAGFALSYCAVAAIIIYGVPLTEFISAKIRPFRLIPRNALGISKRIAIRLSDILSGGVAIAFAASFASAPLTLYFFGVCAPFAVLYSVIYVLGASFCVCCAAAAMVLPEIIAKLPNTAASITAMGLDATAEFISSLNLSVEADISSYWAALAAEAAFLATAQILASNGAGKKAFFLAPPLAGAITTVLACMF